MHYNGWIPIPKTNIFLLSQKYETTFFYFLWTIFRVPTVSQFEKLYKAWLL